jgi:biopolymer transport protein ExbD
MQKCYVTIIIFTIIVINILNYSLSVILCSAAESFHNAVRVYDVTVQSINNKSVNKTDLSKVNMSHHLANCRVEPLDGV